MRNNENESNDHGISAVLNKTPEAYHGWLKSLPEVHYRQEFFDRIIQKGLHDAVVMTVRQSDAYFRPVFTGDDDAYFSDQKGDKQYLHRRAEWTESNQIRALFLEQSPHTFEILLDACKSANARMRLVGAKHLREFGNWQCEDLRSRVIEVLRVLHVDQELFVRIEAGYMLWELAPELVCDDRKLVEDCLNHLLESEPDFSAPDKPGCCVVKFALWHHRDKTIDQLLPPRIPKVQTERATAVESLKRFYLANNKNIPTKIIWVTNPLEALLCVGSKYALDADAPREAKQIWRNLLNAETPSHASLQQRLVASLLFELRLLSATSILPTNDSDAHSVIGTTLDIELRSYGTDSTKALHHDVSGSQESHQPVLVERIQHLFSPHIELPEGCVRKCIEYLQQTFTGWEVVNKSIQGTSVPGSNFLDV